MPDKPKTLVILSPAFPADESETAWVPSKQLFVKKLKENFPELHIIVLTFLHPAHTKNYNWKDVEVIPFNGMEARRLSRLKLWWRVWKTLSRLKRENDLIGIYSFWCGQCALVGKWFARRNGLKHFCWISGMDARKDNRLVKLIRPKPGELVAMSIFLVEEFQKNHGIKPAHLIPIGTDSSEYDNNPVQRDIDIFGAGSFNAFKQYDLFIEVVKKLAAERPNVKAVLCGQGPEKEKLEGLIKKYGLEKNIRLAGMKPKKEVLQYMRRSRIFIHPSSYEGFGAVCLEALHAGAQVISFCDPMKTKEPSWHIVQTAEEMAEKAGSLLSTPLEHKPVILYSMSDSARAVMRLFFN